MGGPRLDIRARQAPLRQGYTDDPASAPRTITVRGGGWDLEDPLHAVLVPDSTPAVPFRAGTHPALGGDDDAPCSADLLLASLAACREITLRMVAANMEIALEELEVTVEGDWDPRGTLAMGREFPSASRPSAPTRASWPWTSAARARSGCCAARRGTESCWRRCAARCRSRLRWSWRR